MSAKINCVPRVAAVRFQVAATFSTSLLTFDSGKSGAVVESIRASVSRLLSCACSGEM